MTYGDDDNADRQNLCQHYWTFCNGGEYNHCIRKNHYKGGAGRLKKQTYLKGSLILMISAAAAKLLGALFKIPLTNILGGVGMSYFSCAYSIFMPVYALIVTGISSAVAAMTAKSAALGLYRNAKKIRSTALMIFSAAGIPGSMLMILLAKPFSIYSVNTPDAAAAVAMIAPAVFFGCITASLRGYYEGMSNMYPTAVSQVIEGLVKVFSGLWLCGYVTENADAVLNYFPGITDIRAIAAAAGILGVTLSSVGATIYLGIMQLFVHNENGRDHTVMSRKAISRELIRTALPIGTSAVVTNLTALIDMWTVIGCLGFFGASMSVPESISPDEFPQFVYGSFAGIALTVFNLVPSVTNMLGKGALTCAASAKERGDNIELRRSTMQSLLIAAVISVPAASGLAALSPEILGFLFPRQSDEVSVCVNALRLLMPGMICLCISFPLFSMLQAVGKPSMPLKIMLIGTAAKLLGNLGLIPVMGVNGAAVSTSLCYVLILALSLRAYRKASGVVIDKAPFFKVVYSGAMCGISTYLVSSTMSRAGVGGLTRVASAVVCGGSVYILVMIVIFGREALHKNKSPKRA